MTEPMLRVQAALTDRDLILLGWLADHGVLTTEQIGAALFPSVNVAQRRLRALMNLRLVDRFRPQRADGGSYPYHWLLAQLGTDVIATQRGEEAPRRDQARQRRWHLTNRANLPHLLGSNDFFIRLAAYARTHPDARLRRWWSAGRCLQRGAFFDITLAYRLKVHPDGHGIFTDRGATTAFFLEYDTGSEPLGRLVDKIVGYHDLARVTEQLWPALFWLPSPIRERNLHEALSRAGISYPVATAVHAHTATGGHPGEAAQSPAGPVWWLHRHPGSVLALAGLSAAIPDLTSEAA